MGKRPMPEGYKQFLVACGGRNKDYAKKLAKSCYSDLAGRVLSIAKLRRSVSRKLRKVDPDDVKVSAMKLMGEIRRLGVIHSTKPGYRKNVKNRPRNLQARYTCSSVGHCNERRGQAAMIMNKLNALRRELGIRASK